jgi:hypothetical protein
VLSDDPAACAAPACSSAGAAVPDDADGTDELPESDVQPATKIPAIRSAEATSVMMILRFMGYVSLMVRENLLL